MLINLDAAPTAYKRYLKLIRSADVVQALRISHAELMTTAHAAPPDKWDYAYAPDKWTAREVLCHLIDAERVFQHRALHAARQDANPLFSFDQNHYARRANAFGRPMEMILRELTRVRESSVELFLGLSPEALLHEATMNGAAISAALWGYLVAGHEAHHLQILREKYL